MQIEWDFALLSKNKGQMFICTTDAAFQWLTGGPGIINGALIKSVHLITD